MVCMSTGVEDSSCEGMVEKLALNIQEKITDLHLSKYIKWNYLWNVHLGNDLDLSTRKLALFIDRNESMFYNLFFVAFVMFFSAGFSILGFSLLPFNSK